jgi:CheY-like chemotaxis protein
MKTIMIVEDEDEVRKHLANIIEKLGFNIIEAGTGEEAIELYKLHRPDLVLLDLILPGIDGDEVLKNIKKTDENARVYFMTGYTEDLSEEKGKRKETA